MKLESDILRKFANEIAEGISRKTISALQKITGTLSGDDSGLINAWDEICVQVQHEYSIYWDVYVQMVDTFVLCSVEELKEHEKSALWFQTEEGWDWLYEYGQEKEEFPPVSHRDIAEYIVKEYILNKAENWSNGRIRAYLAMYY